MEFSYNSQKFPIIRGSMVYITIVNASCNALAANLILNPIMHEVYTVV